MKCSAEGEVTEVGDGGGGGGGDWKWAWYWKELKSYRSVSCSCT